MTNKPEIILTDVTLRDGSHSVRHQFTVEQVKDVVGGLDEAKIPYIEVSHGDGLGGSSLQYGLSKVDQLKLIEAAADTANFSKISVLLLPGIGTIENLKDAHKAGAKMVRVATHVTEADISKQHIETARELGLETVGFLMMSHMAPVEKVVEQAKLMEKYGAETVYVVDSAGAQTPDMVRERVNALRQELAVDVGFHAHNNLGLAMGNTLAAIEAGATKIDGSVRALGAGAGNTQTEVLAAVLEKLGYPTGVDLYKVMDVAEKIVAPLLPKPQEIDRDSLILGFAGVYSSFLLHAKQASEKFGVDTRDILIELGNQKVVGGQEDQIVDVASKIAGKEKEISEIH